MTVGKYWPDCVITHCFHTDNIDITFANLQNFLSYAVPPRFCGRCEYTKEFVSQFEMFTIVESDIDNA